MRILGGIILAMIIFGAIWLVFWGVILNDSEWIMHDGDDPETIWQRSLPDSEEVARYENGDTGRNGLSEGPDSGADRED